MIPVDNLIVTLMTPSGLQLQLLSIKKLHSKSIIIHQHMLTNTVVIIKSGLVKLRYLSINNLVYPGVNNKRQISTESVRCIQDL